MKTATLIITLFLLCPVYLCAQDNLLKRKVTYQASDEDLEHVFLAISDQAQFTFSYNTTIIPEDRRVSLQAQGETVRSLLGTILPENVDYKVSGNHLILLKKPEHQDAGKKEKYTISGYVQQLGKHYPVPNVLVYEVNGLVSAVTNDKGYFSLTVAAPYEHLGLSFNRQGYKDTIVFVKPVSQEIKVYLREKKVAPSVEKIDSKLSDSPSEVESLSFVQQFVSSELLSRTQNTTLFKRRFAQISFLPMLGSNLEMSGLVENNVSVNVLAGYTYGLRGFEIGGLFNVTRKEMHGIQIGGLGNLVGGNSTGFQMAGLINHNRGSFSGVQIGGLHNTLIDTLRGVQISGLNNWLNGGMDGLQIAGLNNLTTRNVDGTQIAGLSNIAFGDVEFAQVAGMINLANAVNGAQISGMGNVARKEIDGFQIGGMVNFSAGNVEAFQVAGMANYTHKDVEGFQLSGMANVARNVGAFQIAGMMNIARDSVSGAQLSGLLNYARYTKSGQIGFLNYADTAAGIPVGFLSFVRKGFHTLEYSANELVPVQLAFKTGVRRFYNIFSAGIGSWSGNSLWMYGYGLGTEQPVGKNQFVNLEYSGHWVNEEKVHAKDLSLLNRINISYGYRIPRGPAFSIGPSFNIWLSEWVDTDTGEYLTRMAPYKIYNHTVGTTQVQFWVGGRLAIHW